MVQALGPRAILVHARRRQPLASAPKKGGVKPPQSTILVGVIVDPTAALQLRDMGPPADDVQVRLTSRPHLHLGFRVLGFGAGMLNSHAGHAYLTFTSVSVLILVQYCGPWETVLWKIRTTGSSCKGHNNCARSTALLQSSRDSPYTARRPMY